MAIDAEDILVCLWRFLRLFIDTSYICAQKHPFVSCMLLLFFFIYVFFNFLVYHSPFLIFIAILLRFFWTSESEQPAIQNVKSEEIKERLENQRKPLKIPQLSADHDVVAVSCSESPSLRRQKSRRTRVKPKEKRINIEWNTTIPQILEENELLLPLSVAKRSWSFQHEVTSTTRDNNTGFEISKQLDNEHRLPCEGAEIESRKFDGNDVGLETETETAEDVEDEEEEEAHEGVNNKAVEWTEDDQKNLVDLGLSEIERNRRLESLIAKRRARKLIKNQLEKGLIDSESSVPPSSSTATQTPAPIFVARSNPFDAPNVVNGIEGLQVPGSAPSILLPTQNPFDLPYDPLEEKPNLMADSFTQEFTAVNQKEMTFCRHESFTLGPFQFDTEQDRRDTKFGACFPTEKRAPEGLGYSRFSKQSGDHDRLIEQLLGGVGKSHIDHTPPIVQSEQQCSLQVSNSETSNVEGDTETKNDVISEEEILNDMESANQMDSISTITEVDTDPSIAEDSETTSSTSSEVADRCEVPTHGYHVEDDNMFSCSIPTIVESLYDSSPSANDKRRMEDDGRVFFGDKHAVHTPSYSIASDLQVEVSEVSSPPLTVGNITPTDGESLCYDEENFDGASYEDMSKAMEEVEIKLRDFSSSEALAPENPETTMQLSEKLAAHPFFEVPSETIDKSSNLPDESIERSAVYDVRDLGSDIIDDIESQEKHEDGDGEEQILTRQESVVYMPEPDEDLQLEFSEINSQNLANYLSVDSARPTKRDADLNLEGDSKTQTQQESVEVVPKSIEAEDHSIKIVKRKDEQSVLESEVSCINQSDEEAFAPAEQEDSIVEVVIVVDSSLPSSPTAATTEQIPVDEVPSSNPDEIQKFDTEDHVMQSSTQEEESPNDTSLIVPQNVILQARMPLQIGQVPSASEKISDVEANIIFNVSEPVIERKSSIKKSETNKDTKEEAETLFNPEVAEESSETHGETGCGPNENIQTVLEKSLSPPDESMDQIVVHVVRDSISDTIDNMKGPEKHEDGDGGEQMLFREIVDDKAEVESNAGSGGDSEYLTHPIKSDMELKLMGNRETQAEQESVPDAAKLIGAENTWSIIEERKDEQSLVESEVSCINQKHEETVASANKQQELIVEEEVFVNSSSSSSPTAATIELILVEEASSSNLDQRMQSMDAPIFDTEDVMQSRSQEEQSLRDGIIMIKPQNEDHSVEGSSNHIPNTSHSETLQDPFASKKFTDEAKILSNISEPLTEDNNEEAATNFSPEVAVNQTMKIPKTYWEI